MARPTMIYEGVHEMPPPDARIRIGDNMIYPAMFFYAPEGADLHAIARKLGFELQISAMENADHLEYLLERGDIRNFMLLWRPSRGRFREKDGWRLAGAYDTEDGPTAMFLRRLADQRVSGAAA